MPDINNLEVAQQFAQDAASLVVDKAYEAEALVGKVPLHVSSSISAEVLETSEQEALAAVIADVIDKWQDIDGSIAKDWKRSVTPLMLSAMILKGITGSSFGTKRAEEDRANLMATEIRPSDLDKTTWAVSTTAGDVFGLIGTSVTDKLLLTQETGKRKVICVIKNGFLTIDHPLPFNEMQVVFDGRDYEPYTFGEEGLVPVGSANNKLLYTARFNPLIIQPGIGTYVGAKATETVNDLPIYVLGMTFYESTAYTTL